MITAHLLDGLLCKSAKKTHHKKHHRKAVIFLMGATVVLIAVGSFFGHEKVVEYGTLWFFEQMVGGVKSTLLGGPPE